jgi:hypothetical protein
MLDRAGLQAPSGIERCNHGVLRAGACQATFAGHGFQAAFAIAVRWKGLAMRLVILLAAVWLAGGCVHPSEPSSSGELAQASRPIKWANVEPLPQPEPGTPMKANRNRYAYEPKQPEYLLVRYPLNRDRVDEHAARQAMARSLLQVREYGSGAFPRQVNYVAVIVVSLHDRDPRRWQQAHRYGAVFPARKVFNAKVDLDDLVAHGDLDAAPFILETPTRAHRWTVVERHSQLDQTE